MVKYTIQQRIKALITDSGEITQTTAFYITPRDEKGRILKGKQFQIEPEVLNKPEFNPQFYYETKKIEQRFITQKPQFIRVGEIPEQYEEEKSSTKKDEFQFSQQDQQYFYSSKTFGAITHGHDDKGRERKDTTTIEIRIWIYARVNNYVTNDKLRLWFDNLPNHPRVRTDSNLSNLVIYPNFESYEKGTEINTQTNRYENDYDTIYGEIDVTKVYADGKRASKYGFPITLKLGSI